jgi:hypothetical protein
MSAATRRPDVRRATSATLPIRPGSAASARALDTRPLFARSARDYGARAGGVIRSSTRAPPRTRNRIRRSSENRSSFPRRNSAMRSRSVRSNQAMSSAFRVRDEGGERSAGLSFEIGNRIGGHVQRYFAPLRNASSYRGAHDQSGTSERAAPSGARAEATLPKVALVARSDGAAREPATRRISRGPRRRPAANPVSRIQRLRM